MCMIFCMLCVLLKVGIVNDQHVKLSLKKSCMSPNKHPTFSENMTLPKFMIRMAGVPSEKVQLRSG